MTYWYHTSLWPRLISQGDSTRKVIIACTAHPNISAWGAGLFEIYIDWIVRCHGNTYTLGIIHPRMLSILFLYPDANHNITEKEKIHMSCVQSRAHQLVSRAVLKFHSQDVFLLFPRVFTVPYFFVRSSGSNAYRYGRPSWFNMSRGGWCRGLQRSVEGGENPLAPK